MRAVFVVAMICCACSAPTHVDEAPDQHDPPLPVGDDPDAPAPDDPPDDVDAGPTDAGEEVPPPPPPPPDFDAAPTNVPEGPLCEEPDDPARPRCAIEVDNSIARETSGARELRIVAWNVRFGAESAAILDALRNNDALRADVLLLSEVARADSQSDPVGIHQARDLALALGMNYAFAVEWDHRYADDYAEPRGEHGVAVLSRFPLGELTEIRHTPAHDWWNDPQRLDWLFYRGATATPGTRIDARGSDHYPITMTLER
jgi:hypothetical protein